MASLNLSTRILNRLPIEAFCIAATNRKSYEVISLAIKLESVGINGFLGIMDP
jgi:hypothetical protein